jgi:superoxide reductase
MTSLGQIWKCEICGNIVEVLHDGSDSLVCCGQAMGLIEAKNEDEREEKHVPVIENSKVKIGEVVHPMEENHYIEWIEATSKEGLVSKKVLNVGDFPEVDFGFEVVSARAYCNVHGLWKTN